MKYFPLKTILCCLIFIPFIYIATLNFYQKVLNQIYFQKIEENSIGETPILLKGLISIEEQLSKNIHAFSDKDKMVQHLGLDLNVVVTTHMGKLLYPTFTDPDVFIKNYYEDENLEKTAKRNFEILNNGLIFKVRVNLNHGSRIANFILFVYFGCAILVILIFYKISSTRAKRDIKLKDTLIDGLQKEEQAHKKLLENMKRERRELLDTIKSLKVRFKEDKKKLKINEEVMFDEIISLEDQLNSINELKYKNDEEIKKLKVKIKKYERRKSSKSKRSEFDFTVKHFAVLYKEIEMNRKAISGFLALNDDQKIKAEECVHRLDREPEDITIKRKVFSGKRHKTSCFEILFAYNGRLYFRKNDNNKIQVLVIGTKNSQAKDMEFLHKL